MVEAIPATPAIPQFKVGDNAVYPAHGVAVVKNIEKKVVGGKTLSFYVLQIVENEMTIMVPLDSVESVGLRAVISRNKVKEVYDILKKRDVKLDNQTWNRRYREYMEKIKTGSVYEIAAVLRDLFLLKHTKDLSFGEKRMLDTARSLLVKEISLAKNADEDAVKKEIESFFS
ncbi:MAG: CarD family transcriptional regulator [Deltaproteobacteria bacterium]|nr:CarD family transcriptional regulator [Deltaproteobacteria bacterium]